VPPTDRDTRGSDFFLGAFGNSRVMIARSEDQAQQIVKTVHPLLKRIGGICLVSDALWVLH
jgi:16S rRNA C1402 (ribose-2'-O) methylase RsmI